jgi:hypothetical protein
MVSDEDDEQHPTIPSGYLPHNWCEPRLRCSGQLSGCFALPSHHETLPTLREQFLPLATRAELADPPEESGAACSRRLPGETRENMWPETMRPAKPHFAGLDEDGAPANECVGGVKIFCGKTPAPETMACRGCTHHHQLWCARHGLPLSRPTTLTV